MDKNVYPSHLIGPEWISSPETIANMNPATGEIIGHVPVGTWVEIEKAVSLAETAQVLWEQVPAQQKSKLLIKLAQLIERDQEMLSTLESEDSGIPKHLALNEDIPWAIEILRYYSQSLYALKGESFSNGQGHLQYTLLKPIGVVGIITSFNHSLLHLTRKLAPALATGNAVIMRPSELSPRSAHHLGKLIIEAGIPSGVVHIIHGSISTDEALVAHPRIKAISFNGSTKRGKAINEACAPMLKKVSLELGAKNASIIFASSNLNKAIPEIVRAGFSHSGHMSLSTGRILIESSIYDRVKQMIKDELNTLRIGDPLSEKTHLGPMASETHLHRILVALSDVEGQGGTLLCGGERLKFSGPMARGCFIGPTVVEGSNENSDLNQEEILGPVVSLMRFRDEDHALRLANNSRYGMMASVWTENLGQAHRLAQGLQTAMVSINCLPENDPRHTYGGEKNSGMGREGAHYSLEFFTTPRAIVLKPE